ncbi:cytochrome P450 [Serendipita vermifera]|nr:cytochrome P450 [Serendipita vermifera]
MDFSASTIIPAAFAAPILWAFWARVSGRGRPPYPPGPKRYPFIGSVLSFPQCRWYEKFTEWREIYGDIIYADLLGTPIVIISSLAMAEDLCARRGAIYSGRPRSLMMNELMGWEWNIVGLNPTPTHAALRRIFRESLGPQVVPRYDVLIQQHAENYIRSLRDFQGSPVESAIRAVGAVVITLAYGPGVYEAHGKELTELNQKALDQVTWVGGQLWLVEFLPILKKLPDWTPGAVFKRVAAEASVMARRIHLWPWEEVNTRYKNGTSGPCIAVNYIERGHDLDLARDAIGMMYAAGVDTTSATVINFLFAMMVHPHIQKKVQAELDAVIGHSRIPIPTDRPRLPYADATWRESVRWHPTLVLGVPHNTIGDDIYKGMYIPNNAMILINMGRMLRDPEIFSSPDEFQPERWLESHNPNAKNLPDVNNIAFGFGTRICAGRFLAERIAFTMAMSILLAYDIVPVDGKDMPSIKDTLYEDAVITRPIGFECAFKPRSELSSVLLSQA